MKYCYDFSNKLKSSDMQKAEELKIWYRGENSDLEVFLETYPNCLIILCVTDIDVFFKNAEK